MLRDAVPDDILNQKVCFVAGGWASQVFCLDNNCTTVRYRCKDIDIFVIGEAAIDEENFHNFVNAAVDRLKDSGHYIRKIKARRWNYTNAGMWMWLVDVYVRGMKQYLSFIQKSGLYNIQHVIDDFDINVVQVVYDIQKDKATASYEVANAIRTKTARVVRPFVFLTTVPDVNEEAYLCRTLHRIQKYNNRGYKFMNMPRLTALHVPDEPSHPVDNSLALTILERQQFVRLHDPTALNVAVPTMRTAVELAHQRYFIRHAFSFFIESMEYLFPTEDLLSGVIGVGGPLILAKYMCDYHRLGIIYSTRKAYIFVGGRHGRTEQAFRKLITSIHRRVRQSFPNNGFFAIESGGRLPGPYRQVTGPYVSAHMFCPQPLGRITFQIVPCPSHDIVFQNLHVEYISGLSDLWYNFRTKTIDGPSTTLSELRRGLLTVGRVNWDEYVPTNRDISNVETLFTSMRELADAGFYFKKYPEFTLLA